MNEIRNRQTFDRLLKKRLDDMLVLGNMVEQAVVRAVAALEKRDTAAARRVYENDRRVNERRFRIEEDTIVLIATQQPIARDLRMLSSLLELITELERMGDYAKGIARIAIELDKLEPIPFPHELTEMAAEATDMLNRALEAFVKVDVAVAYQIPEMDERVDKLYNKINRHLIQMVAQEPESIDRANYMMWASHNLERLADRVTNICERTIYVDTGEMMEFGKKLTVYSSS